MYKSFSSLTIASALVATAVSSVAYSQQPTLEYLSETINNVPRVIYVKDLGSSNGIKIVQGQDSDQMHVNVTVLAENDAKMQEYKSKFMIGAERIGDHIRLSRKSKQMYTSYACTISSFGSMVKVTGACEDRITLIIPSRFEVVMNVGSMVVLKLKGSTATDQNSIGTVTEEQASLLKVQIESESFGSGKVKVTQNFVQAVVAPKGLRFTPSQVASLITDTSFDSDKINMLKILAKYLTSRDQTYKAIEGLFSFSSSKSEAATILMSASN